MSDFWMRIAGNLADRIHGTMHFRFILQPVVASVLAILSGLRDARERKPPYFWALLTHAASRRDRLRDGWKSVGKVFVMALVLDIVYQVLVFRFVYSGEVLIVGFILTIVPYLALRGLVTRLAARK
ncbi:MAG: hypothetical protein P4M09_14835 [Devosia sp.]|nr:hypothetical protein [Devosia sp.]